jgi:predicted transcriptional regulator
VLRRRGRAHAAGTGFRSVLIANPRWARCSSRRCGADPGRLHTYRGDRQYRSRVEILRDFLDATRRSGRKTRIIGLANLNPESFQRYLELSLALELVETAPGGGYRTTGRAEVVLDSISRLLAKSGEVDSALRDLQRGLDGFASAPGENPVALRYVSRIAWNEMVRSTLLGADSDGALDLSSGGESAEPGGAPPDSGTRVAPRFVQPEPSVPRRRNPRFRTRL